MLLEYVNWDDVIDDEAAPEVDDIGEPEMPLTTSFDENSKRKFRR